MPPTQPSQIEPRSRTSGCGNPRSATLQVLLDVDAPARLAEQLIRTAEAAGFRSVAFAVLARGGQGGAACREIDVPAYRAEWTSSADQDAWVLEVTAMIWTPGPPGERTFCIPSALATASTGVDLCSGEDRQLATLWHVTLDRGEIWVTRPGSGTPSRLREMSELAGVVGNVDRSVPALVSIRRSSGTPFVEELRLRAALAALRDSPFHLAVGRLPRFPSEALRRPQ